MKTLACLLLSCTFAVHLIPYGFTQKTYPPDKLTFKYDSVKAVSKVYKSNTNIKKGYCTVVYPLFNDAVLNNIILKVAVIPIVLDQKRSNSYQGMVKGYIDQFEEIRKNDPGEKSIWTGETKISVVENRKNFVSVLCTKDYFAGGLHDEYSNIYINYNPLTHQQVTLKNLIKPGKMEELNVIAEKIFLKEQGLKPNESLESYNFPHHKFALAHTFTIDKNGLKFVYDYNEVTAFAAGKINLVIPFNQLKDIAYPNSILVNN